MKRILGITQENVSGEMTKEKKYILGVSFWRLGSLNICLVSKAKQPRVFKDNTHCQISSELLYHEAYRCYYISHKNNVLGSMLLVQMETYVSNMLLHISVRDINSNMVWLVSQYGLS